MSADERDATSLNALCEEIFQRRFATDERQLLMGREKGQRVNLVRLISHNMSLGVPAARIPTERCVQVYWLKNNEPRHTWQAHTGRARARTMRVHGSELAWDIRIMFPYRAEGLRKVKRLVSTPERSGFPTHSRAAGSSTTHMIISTRRIRASMGRGESGPDKVLGRNCDPVVVHRSNS